MFFQVSDYSDAPKVMRLQHASEKSQENLLLAEVFHEFLDK